LALFFILFYKYFMMDFTKKAAYGFLGYL